MYVHVDMFMYWSLSLWDLDMPFFFVPYFFFNFCLVWRRNSYGAWEQYPGLERSDNAPKRSYTAKQVFGLSLVAFFRSNKVLKNLPMIPCREV